MGKALATFSTVPDSPQAVTLGALSYRVRLYYRVRLRGWYMDISDANSVALVTGRRISPSWGPLLGIKRAGLPDGYIYIQGPDVYERSDLGEALLLIYYESSELPAAPVVTDAVTVAIQV